MTRRVVAAVLLVTALVGALTACVQDRPGDGVAWLRGQSGVVDAQALSEHNDISGTSGIVRGELDPGLDAAGLAGLVDSVQGYLASHGGVSIRLGRDLVDFAVSTDDDETASALATWEKIVDVPGLVNGVVTADEVHVRTMRDDQLAVLGDLEPLGDSLRVEGFTNRESLDTDTGNDDFFGDDYGTLDSLQVLWPSTCSPEAGVRGILESFVLATVIEGGTLRLCDRFDIQVDEDAALAGLARDLYAELDARASTGFPVSAHQAIGAAPDGRVVALTPGDPAAFGMLEAFTEPVDGQIAAYELFDDRSFEVALYSAPLASLVARVQSSEAAALSPFLRIEGADAAVGGALADLGSLADQAVALAAASEEFSHVELNVDAGRLTLSSPVATDPDVLAAVAALRASGATTGRTFYVTYLQTQVNIIDGVASLPSDYTDGHVVEAFMEAWNAG